ncbi:MAG TPA: CDP-alcohol phosphatidyltransferase family protein [Nocardioidaceae bacterium]|jgi:CDP-diacylglycerol--glycerol-3-phosphate 3-phosphatidyltransferase/CDP-diacylglycerol--inositol 3-phosphatidyltransferase|nr:CDP-alcohol phosphatidyltransferase family protein [Nocardioidaceae bacterium]
MFEHLRTFFTNLISPVARLLLRLNVSPDAVTVVGTAGVVAAALWFFPRGQLIAGVLVITAFVFSDLLDGTMARMSGRTSTWGAFLDSTLDRMGDSAIFGGLVLYYANVVGSEVLTALTLYCLVTGWLTSYARARAESLGYEAKGGIAARADRLVAVLAAAGLSDIFDVPVLLEVVLWLLAVASTVTVVQRILTVRRQARATV